MVLLNNDTEVQTADWVQELAAHALREEVGAVAPLLTYPDGRVQHAGAALGLYGYAGHPFAGLAPDRRTAFGAAADGPRNWLAVSAACLMVERRKLVTVGGFDESFAVGGNDVDLCLRLTDAGHRSLCLPHVRLEPPSVCIARPRRDTGELPALARALRRVPPVGDPFYDPDLTLAATDCSLRSPGRCGREPVGSPPRPLLWGIARRGPSEAGTPSSMLAGAAQPGRQELELSPPIASSRRGSSACDRAADHQPEAVTASANSVDPIDIRSIQSLLP